MEIKSIPFEKTGYFSTLICDYLAEKKSLKPFYNRFPNIENFKEQIAEKAKNYNTKNRKVLSSVLLNQYDGIAISDATKSNIENLNNTATFTVTTGHQLNLFTGPIYFLYKIISTINLAEKLKEVYPEYQFVPIYWMATEDHDFDEINHFYFKGKKIQWNRNISGPVGRMDLSGLDELLEIFSNELGNSIHSEELKRLFEKAYLEKNTLAKAMRFLVNELFSSYGLVILDGDDQKLKALFASYIEKDILNESSYQSISKSIEDIGELSNDYSIQVNPREINFFYITNHVRERIVERDGIFYVNNTEFKFSKNELKEAIKNNPERFSPNVVTRPLYQEVILPNLCYIGGGGELAYWLQLKEYFMEMKITFPMLLLRNSALLISDKQKEKATRMDVSIEDFFFKQNQLINKKIREISNIEIDFSPQKEHLEQQFDSLYKLATETDKSFLGAVKAQEVKQKKGLDNLEKRLLKAQKRKLKDHVIRLTTLQNELFPNKSLQERQVNFSEIYLKIGDSLIEELKECMNPLNSEFLILRY